jgi:signal transduction histidine kinase
MKDSNDFIGLILHDISKPIVMLRSSIEILKRPDLPRNKRDDVIKRIEELVEMANYQIRSFRTVYELSLRSFRPQKEFIDIDYLFQQILRQISISTERRKAQISYKKNELKKTNIFVDPKQFSTAIINILQNSLQYTESDPKIKISISQSGNIIKILIDDLGFGFDEEDINHIFKEGWTKHRGDSRDFGLWITKNLLEQNDFDINLISRQNPTSFLISGNLLNQ